jgi:D-alanyl-D-alanine carboxypeptidase
MRLWKGSGCISRKPDFCHRTRTLMMGGWLAIAAALVAAVPPSASARVQSFIVMDAQTGKVLETRNADALCYPASLTKLMTLYITFQQLNSGKLTLSQSLRVSSHAAAQAPTKLYLHPGERISVESAILAITTRSANDAAVVLAEAIGGTEWQFAQLMNQRAAQLGLNHTTFHNASGLPNWRQKTTARDMAKLALAILHNFPQDYHFFDAKSFVFHGKRIHGHDHLLGRCPGVDGMKTGYTRASGFNIVTSAVRHGRRLVGVVMGERSAHSRDRLMVALLERGFSRVQKVTLAAASDEEDATAGAADGYVKVSDEDTERDHTSSPQFGWIVQIGGNFRNRYQARRALKSALHTAPERLKGARPLAVKLGNGRYRARFSDMNEEIARETCRVLRERKFSCHILRVQTSSIALASAGR